MKKKKALAAIVAVALICCVAIGATLAYLQDTTNVAKNTSTLGKVDIFLDEAVVDKDGKATDERTYTGNTDTFNDDFGYLAIPGKPVDKDPTVHVVADSEDCYVRMKVTLDNAANFIKVYKDHNTGASNDVVAAIAALKDCFKGYDENVWKVANAKLNDNDTVTVTFNYVGSKATDGVIAKSAAQTDLEPIITAVMLPTFVTNSDVALFPNGFSVEVIAEAIQATGFDDADAAWTAFDEAADDTIFGQVQASANP